MDAVRKDVFVDREVHPGFRFVDDHSVNRRRIPFPCLCLFYAFGYADEVLFSYLLHYCNSCMVAPIRKLLQVWEEKRTLEQVYLTLTGEDGRGGR